MGEFRIQQDVLDISSLNGSMAASSAGAFVTFEGWVRNKNDGLPVLALEYEIFTALALSEGTRILEEASNRFNLTGVSTIHREGRLAIGDCAIWIGVTAPHRGDAFDGCRFIIDEIKHRLPVWKKEHYEGCDPVWVNCQHLVHHTKYKSLNREEVYARQTALPEIGIHGQEKLAAAKVLIVGAGGLGSSAATALASAGIGCIGICEYDVVHTSNLHRQILYTANDIGKPKAATAAARLKSINPSIVVKIYDVKVDSENVEGLFAGYDIVLDCTDNFKTKYLLNDAAIACKKTLIQASLYRFEGQLLIINPSENQGCLRCLWPEPPLPGLIGDCAEAGVLGTVPMIFGTLQANEAIKMITGNEATFGLMIFDLLSLNAKSLKRTRDANCKTCGSNASPENFKSQSNTNDFFLGEHETLNSLLSRTVIIDVRESLETSTRPVPHTLHMPFTGFFSNTLDVPKDTSILVLCAHGKRSEAAVAHLRKNGWENSFTLAGGVEALSPFQRAATS